MIDHTTFSVADFGRSRDFYARCLAPLSVTILVDLTPEQTGSGAFAGFGTDGKAFFWIGDRGRVVRGVHIAIEASSRAAVDAFHTAALAAGGRDNGAPGLRPHFHENYYGAFVFDPDGNNIEAVCHKPE